MNNAEVFHHGEYFKRGAHGLAYRWDTSLKEWVNSHKTWDEVREGSAVFGAVNDLSSEKYNFTGVK